MTAAIAGPASTHGRPVPEPFLRTPHGAVPLAREVTTVGRGQGCGIRLGDPSVSVLHAELRLLADGDVICFGQVPCTARGMAPDAAGEQQPQRAVPQLTSRELDVLTELCRPAFSQQAFTQPAAVRQIATALSVTENAIKQHLIRLCRKLGIPGGPDRRLLLANHAVALGLVPAPALLAARPPPPGEQPPGPDAWMVTAWQQGENLDAIEHAGHVTPARVRTVLRDAGALP